jgi:glycosyltransferase involved in cell wall biosynthesis
VRILCLIRYYLPGFQSGGPLRTVSNMVARLGDELDFRIVTTDRDVLDTNPYPDVRIGAWNPVGKGRVYYAAPDALTIGSVARLIRDTPHDVLYLNSFFDRRFAVSPLLARRLGWLPDRPVVVAPRGEFSEGALALKAPKKRLYILAARATGLCAGVTWQASSEHEARDIRRAMGHSPGVRIRVAPDLLPPIGKAMRTHKRQARDAGAPLRVIFLSRITPKKNLDFALSVLSRVSVPVEFNIYGTVEDRKYWANCERLIGQLPAHVVAKYYGAVAHSQVPEILARQDLFFFPTRGENYGHVICESLAAGTPVLVSDQTPWRNLDEAGAGWVRPFSDSGAFVSIIEGFARLDPGKVQGMRERAAAYADRVLASPEPLWQNRALFEGVRAAVA